jgi:hypothetical protein
VLLNPKPRDLRSSSNRRPGVRLVRLAWVSVMLIAVPWSLSGCKSTGSSVSPAQAFTVPEWKDLHIQTLAYMGMGSSTGDATARVTAEQIVEQRLGTGQERFVILGMSEGRTRAASADASELYEKVVNVWRDTRKADLFQVQQLSKKLGTDGLIFADLNDWTEERVDWTTEGTSSTQVTIRLAIYSGKTGLLAWEAKKIQRKESEPYRPGQAGGGVYTDQDGTPHSDQSHKLTPDPPRAEDVAADVLAALIAAFPPRTAAP